MRKSEFATLLLAAAFLLMAWSGSWFEIVAEGTYTEGLDREPTIRTQYMIDSSQESFEMSIENATPLLLYWLEREDVSPESDSPGGNSSDIPADPPSSDGGSDPCSGSCLDRAREFGGIDDVSPIRSAMPVFSSPDHSTQSHGRLDVVARNRRDSDRRPASGGG